MASWSRDLTRAERFGPYGGQFTPPGHSWRRSPARLAQPDAARRDRRSATGSPRCSPPGRAGRRPVLRQAAVARARQRADLHSSARICCTPARTDQQRPRPGVALADTWSEAANLIAGPRRRPATAWPPPPPRRCSGSSAPSTWAGGRTAATAQRRPHAAARRRWIPTALGDRTLKDAINEAMRDWVTNVRTTHYPSARCSVPTHSRAWCATSTVSSARSASASSKRRRGVPSRRSDRLRPVAAATRSASSRRSSTVRGYG